MHRPKWGQVETSGAILLWMLWIHRDVISRIMPIIKVNNIVKETVEQQELNETVQMKEYQYIYIVNIVLVITIGGLGNLFTIISICICRIRYVLNNVIVIVCIVCGMC